MMMSTRRKVKEKQLNDEKTIMVNLMFYKWKRDNKLIGIRLKLSVGSETVK